MASDKLTAKQDAFVTAIISGMSQSDAYRSAYDAEKMSDKQVWEEACKLASNPKVAQRLGVLQERAAAKAVLTRAWVLEQLMDNAAKAKAAEDFTASNKALELLGKTDEVPLFVERSIVTSDNRHHHSAEPVSPFAEFLAGVVGPASKGSPEEPVQN